MSWFRTGRCVMCQKDQTVDLGFVDSRMPAGTHICQIYNLDEERNDSLLKYLLSGINSGERVTCFSDNITEDEIEEYFKEKGLSFNEARDKGDVSLSSTGAAYFQNDKFDPDIMLDLLTKFYDDAMKDGYPACRVIGEMSPEIDNVPGGSRLMEYECLVTRLLEDHPVTAVCQYDASKFDGGTIMEVLKVHPQMVVNGMVLNNPFFIPPDEYLG
jgi:hypothetical protein